MIKTIDAFEKLIERRTRRVILVSFDCAIVSPNGAARRRYKAVS